MEIDDFSKPFHPLNFSIHYHGHSHSSDFAGLEQAISVLAIADISNLTIAKSIDNTQKNYQSVPP